MSFQDRKVVSKFVSDLTCVNEYTRIDQTVALELRDVSSSVRLYFGSKRGSKSILDFVRCFMLPTMINQAQTNYRSGFKADSVAMTQRLTDDATLRIYCRDNRLLLDATVRDAPQRELVCHMLAQALPHIARTMSSPIAVQAEATFEGVFNTPLIRLTLV
jgi:hypothetical protein